MHCHTFSNIKDLSWDETIIKNGGLIVRQHTFPYTSLKKYIFLDNEFNVPENIHEHLEANYGNYMVKDKTFSYMRASNMIIINDKKGIISNEHQI